jgi:hypothetical protein
MLKKYKIAILITMIQRKRASEREREKKFTKLLATDIFATGEWFVDIK